MNAYKCSGCSNIIREKEFHHCPNQTYQNISLTPAEYCAKFGHSYVESEMPATRRRFRKKTTTWEGTEEYVNCESWDVLKKCMVCGEGHVYQK